MKSTQMTYLTRFSILVLGLALLSCGASKSTDDLASRLTPGSVSGSDKPLAWCNSGSSANYSANQKAYTDAAGVWNPQYGLVKFTSIPASFSNNSRYIEFFRWMASGDGTSSLDSTPLKFRLVDLSTNQFITDWRTVLGWGALAQAQASTGMTTVSGFFKRVALYIDIRDVAGEYDVLRTVIYRSSDNKADEQFDALLPVFNANPADYATESTSSGSRARPQNLNDLHPLKGTALSSSEYTARMAAFCDPFKEYK